MKSVFDLIRYSINILLNYTIYFKRPPVKNQLPNKKHKYWNLCLLS